MTRAAGDVKDAIGRPVEMGQLAAVDPDCRAIALHLYDGQLKVGQRQQMHSVLTGSLCAFVGEDATRHMQPRQSQSLN